MRIVAGSARGRLLTGPPSTATRPTSDKVRAAVFNIIMALPEMALQGVHVLDLYAGTGAMGIEALSRGAGWVDFVERDAACCRIIKANLAACGVEQHARVHHERVESWVERWMTNSTRDTLYDLIMLDPPYSDPGTPDVLAVLGRCHSLSSSALVVYEHTKRTVQQSDYGLLHYWRTKTYGDTAVSMWRVAEQEEDGAARDPGNLPRQL